MEYNIIDFGASIDNHYVENTKAINQLIEEVSSKGGGRIKVPAGKFHVTSLELKSNIEFVLGPGSTLFFETNDFDYPVVDSRWEGVDRPVFRSLIYAEDAENVSVSGTGTIDGNGFSRSWVF